jgi:YebC/PmpR family DNA-binding regulatory protein
MSGHSKWSTIKRKKGAADAARGKIFTRLAREIQVAARDGADPDSNMTLRLAVDRAKAENMPKDNIERAIRRGAGLDKDGADFETVVYEGYGPNGVAILVECLTDNRNRSIADVRRCFNKANGSLGEPNSVAWQFRSRGYILFNLEDEDGNDLGLDSEEIFMAALDAGAEDVVISTDSVEVYTEHADLAQVATTLKEAGYDFDEMQLIMHPNLTLDLSADEASSVMGLVDALDELDDVNMIYHNLNLTDELVAELA